MRTVGRYRILGELGRGAMGVVYRAQDPAIGREIAIKTIRLNELTEPSERKKLRDRLFREAQSAGMLSHSGIVTIYDVAEEGDLAYIAMECVDGPTLERLMRTDPPDGKLVLSILGQTAAALDYAHKRGIVHRDIKPANIMIHDGVAKITDFGVAKFQSHQMTQAGFMVGTPNYMSPEQIQGQEVDGRSDQFSLAVIAYELLTGEKPFAADSIAALAYRIVRDEPSPVNRLNPTLEWPVDTVVRKAMAKSPADRYPTCSDFVFALENACRACRKWTPMATGSAGEQATVVQSAARQEAAREDAAPTVAVAVPKAVRKQAPAAVAAVPGEPEEPEEAPFPLRLLRITAVVVVGALIAAAAIIGGLQYLEQSDTPEETAVAVAPPAPQGPPAQKPSPMAPLLPGEGDAQPAGESQETTDETPAEPAPARSRPPVAPAGPAEVRVVTSPPGAKVVADGDPGSACTAPCVLMLSPGRHTLAATLEGHRGTLRILETSRESEVFLNLERATGTVLVQSSPAGASIVIDGANRQEKTPAMLKLPVGKHRVEVVHNGQREQRDMEVRDSAITNFTVTFSSR